MKKRNNGTYYDSKIVTDPMGSYSGVPLDPEDWPVQDADDL